MAVENKSITFFVGFSVSFSMVYLFYNLVWKLLSYFILNSL